MNNISKDKKYSFELLRSKLSNFKKVYFKTPTRSLQTVSTITQVLFFFLAAIGYVLTVQPINKFERLEEKSAELEKEITKQERELKATKTAIAENYKKIKKTVYIEVGNKIVRCFNESLGFRYPAMTVSGCTILLKYNLQEPSSIGSLLNKKDKEDLVKKVTAWEVKYDECTNEQDKLWKKRDKDLSELKNNTQLSQIEKVSAYMRVDDGLIENRNKVKEIYIPNINRDFGLE